MATKVTQTTETIDTSRTLSTEERLLVLYDLGLDAAAGRRAADVTTVLNELIATLDFGYPDIAEGFFRLYTYCLDRADAGDFDQIVFVLGDLRITLREAVIDAQREPAAPNAASA
jgi:hypothetical protein